MLEFNHSTFHRRKPVLYLIQSPSPVGVFDEVGRCLVGYSGLLVEIGVQECRSGCVGVRVMSEYWVVAARGHSACICVLLSVEIWS